MTAPFSDTGISSFTLSSTYNPQELEPELYQFWESSRFFRPEVHPQASGRIPEGAFSLVIPPPNVTGVLHMGHALDCTLQDILVRWHRMRGEETLWMPGTDHAGIATQNVVERQLRESTGQTKHDLGRDVFLEQVWDWAKSRQGDILGQFRRLGISPDWERQRFTLDTGLSKAVREAFVRLYEQGLIYQGTYIVNWCPRCTSAISDIETDYVDEDSFLWEIVYPLVSTPEHPEPGSLVVATTRPETLFADVALAVNPKDLRTRHYIGRKVRVPLSEREIPVIGDDYVDIAFGTGVLKITPAHDPNDFKIGLAHKLEPLYAIDEQGRLRDEPHVPESLRGLDRSEARIQTEAQLREHNLLLRKQAHAHRVGKCQRCATTIEPLLSKQWFVKTQPLADRALQALENGELRFIPERWTKDFVRWMTDIQDWCISRQLWWGHQIPVWVHNVTGEMRVQREAPEDPAFVQESDVLDTWFSSGLWPFSTMGWPDAGTTLGPDDLQKFYPTQVLVTGFDIIFFWVARMVMFGLAFTDQAPFNTVYIHGLIRDEKGQKMSKSKGNTVDPVEVIDRVGCDGFRYALTSLVTYGGQDIKLSPDRVEVGRLFANKLWNASRFVLMNLVSESGEVLVDDQPLDLDKLNAMDRWTLAGTEDTVQKANTLLAEFKFGELANTLYDFTWNVFCDWTIEAAKEPLRDPEQALNTRRLLLYVLDTLLRLWHPIMPYLTEAVWQKLPIRPGYASVPSISLAPYPIPLTREVRKCADFLPSSTRGEGSSTLTSPLMGEVGRSSFAASPGEGELFRNETADVDFVLEVIRAIRNIRQQVGVPGTLSINVRVETEDPQEKAALLDNEAIVRRFVKVDICDVSSGPGNGAGSGSGAGSGDGSGWGYGIGDIAVNVVGHSRVIVPLAGLVDPAVERARLEKKLAPLQKEFDKLSAMLGNPDFVASAPPPVVAKNQTRLEELTGQLAVLGEQLSGLG